MCVCVNKSKEGKLFHTWIFISIKNREESNKSEKQKLWHGIIYMHYYCDILINLTLKKKSNVHKSEERKLYHEQNILDI